MENDKRRMAFIAAADDLFKEKGVSNMGGGFMGFTKDDKFILGNMSKEKAIEMGYRV